MQDLWGQADRFIARLERARAEGVDIFGDVYPYDYWETTLTQLFPARDFRNVDSARYALEHVVGPEGIRFTEYKPDPLLVGKTVAEIAAARHEDTALTLQSLIVDSATPEEFELETMKGMSQTDVDRIVAWPHANICSDGYLVDQHPRAAGAFTRILRDYVRERHLLSLEEAVRKMTSLAAANMGIPDRGLIRLGFFADLVLFDPDSVSDQSTVSEPHRLSTGVQTVWVNGVRVFDGGQTTGARPGRIIRHQIASPGSDPSVDRRH